MRIPRLPQPRYCRSSFRTRTCCGDARAARRLAAARSQIAVAVLLLGSGCLWAQERDAAERPAALAPAAEQAVNVQGTVTFAGEIPRARIADNAGQRAPLLQVDRKSGGLADAVVYLVPTRIRDDNTRQDSVKQPAQKAAQQTPPKSELKKAAAPALVIDQVEHRFAPHLSAVRAGETVQFTNSDAANHNVRSAAIDEPNEFNVITAAGGHYRHRFVAPGDRPAIVRLGCDIHPWMRAWIYVFSHELYGVTDKRGRYAIRGATPGSYELFVRQPDGGLSHKQTVSLRAGTPLTVDVAFTAADLADQ